MKICEILELTQSKKLSEIAKEHLEIGEKKAVAGLKLAGCFNISGKRGWYFEGDETVLQQSIYEYAPVTSRGGKPKAKAQKQNASISESIDTSVNESTDTSKKLVASELLASEKESASTVESKSTSKSKGKSKSASIDESINESIDTIDMLLSQNQDTSTKRVYRGFYWDNDVLDFIDNVKHGNKSDLMNEIVRTVLKAKGLI